MNQLQVVTMHKSRRLSTATKRSITQRFVSLNVASLNVIVSKRKSFKT